MDLIDFGVLGLEGGAIFQPPLKPFLQWVGGKRQLMPEILERVPQDFETFYEPFVGAGSVFLELTPQRAVINDYNEELVNTYLCVRDNLEGLLSELEVLQGKVNSKDYYEIRAWDREEDFLKIPKEKRAARTIYLNKTGFNGLYRVNPKGYFNVPFNKNERSRVFDEPQLRDISKFLNNSEIEIMSGDYKDVLALPGEGDFVYLDPPYDYEDENGFTDYTKTPFGRTEQEELYRELAHLDEIGVKWLYSNNSTTFIRGLFEDFDISEVFARRSVNSKGNGRGKVPEVLIKNF